MKIHADSLIQIERDFIFGDDWLEVRSYGRLVRANTYPPPLNAVGVDVVFLSSHPNPLGVPPLEISSHTKPKPPKPQPLVLREEH